MTGDRLAFAAITTTYLLVAIPWEERSLGRQFGERLRALPAAGAVAGRAVHLLIGSVSS